MPPITDAVTIDGYTQPGASPNTQLTSDDAVLLIEINGESSGDESIGLEVFNPAAVTIRGLVINRFQVNVSLAPSGHLEGCFVGTDATGTLARSRADDGVIGVLGGSIGGSSPSQRNVISGNNGWGISGGHLIQGNFIGIDATGTTALPNGINVSAGGAAMTTIGGTAAPAGAPPGNVISGSLSEGIRFIPHCRVVCPHCQPSCTMGSIRGNLIGTNAAGTAAVPNLGHGVVAGTSTATSTTLR